MSSQPETALETELADIPRLPRGSRVLVTGASGGIGREVLRLLSVSEAKVGAHFFQNRQALETCLESLSRAGGPARFEPFGADLSWAESASKLVDAFTRWAGGIDVLIQLSGAATQADPATVTPIVWRNDLEVNLISPFFLAREAMKRMRDSGGRIVLTGTASAAHGGGRTTMAYGAAKAGIECVVKGLAREGAPRSILVNAVVPGFIDTEFHSSRLGRTPEQLRERAQLVPVKRAGTPFEVAGVVVFLVSRLASYVTGECIAVSGGDWL